MTTPSEETLTLGQLLRRWRLAATTTQADLAASLGTGTSLVSNWENDRVRPSRELTERLLEAAAAQDTELTAALRDHLDALAYHESQQEVAAAERRRHLGLREDVFSLPEGQVLVRWPADVPPEEIPALADWLELIKHKITRTP